MHRRSLSRAIFLAATGLLLFAGTAFADQLLADGDLANAGVQGTKFLGTYAPGAEVTVDVEFTLNCVLSSHVNTGQTVNLTWSGLGSSSRDGAIVSVTSGSVGPVGVPPGPSWPADGQGCGSPVPSLVGATRSTVTLRAPTTPTPSGSTDMYTVVYDRSLSPADPSSDGTAFSRTATQVSFTLIVPNAAPTLHVPATEEGNTTGGWIVDWSGVSATDPEDNPDPTPTCSPAAGTFLPLGPNTVSCSVTDSNAATTSGNFAITVVDTNPPVLSGVPGDLSLTTSDPSGTVATYPSPAATDVVDPSPTVQCVPASGSLFAVGTTPVICTATDGSGNSSTGGFTVTVDYVAPPNTSPTLSLPASHEEEGNTTGGWVADWSGVSATDPEDDPDPTPTCSPAAGSLLPLGPTTVSCSVSDSAGATTGGSFVITVVDSTPPSLHGMPNDISVTTSGTGAVVTYVAPTATDIVDSSPSVACDHASGGTFDVGTTIVTCVATDGSGNASSDRFSVAVTHVAAQHTASAIWLEPVAGGQVFEANRGRTIPVKVRLFVDGVERSSGEAHLTLTPCGGGDVALEIPLAWNGGRWTASVDTSMLNGTCFMLAASIDGLSAGSIQVELRGEATAARTKAGTLDVPTKPPKKKPR